MTAKENLFTKRAAEGRIRDCHGDLHTAQIFLQNGISIIDCIEFNERFRYADVAQDIAFLAMDLDFHGRADLSRLFVEAYVQESRDPGLLGFLDFFKSYRAYVRGKVTSFRLEDPLLGQEERQEVLAQAQAYFRLAHSYTRILPSPALILVTGLTGTGKSTVAQELTRRWNLHCISSDATRKRLAGIELTAHQYVPFGEGIYSAGFSRRTYHALLQEAEEHLRAGSSVVVDATFRKGEERAKAAVAAQRLGAEMWLVECSLPEEEVRRRLEVRLKSEQSVSDGRWELFPQQQEEWEPIEEVPSDRHLRLNTGGSVQETTYRLLHDLYLSVLQGRPAGSPAFERPQG